ncbi:extracellular signal-regulated kinase 7 isoform X1 [Drosophila grimshawi]|nr:extracellular signal-regulated kinase 7 isoform X1 [Drosophila grimshawi]XP_032594320.1 extracellular signal-regulated kinase 7 isoform X1 [Drosophila grimshawi]
MRCHKGNSVLKHDESSKDIEKENQMAERSKAQERRIYELDQNVERYFDVRKRLGKGAYGIVWKAIDKRQNNTVALKKIYDAFRDETDAQRTYREVAFLRAFRPHPNIIRLLDIFKSSNNLDFYLVFEYMDSDLHNVIRKGNVLRAIHKRFVTYQLINAIRYMHSGNVIHRDLKPSNILIDNKCRIKVADFGLARTLCVKRRTNSDYESKDELDSGVMLTDYVATRWYRAPEILVASRRYTKGIDMWSLGCILAEMILQKPLFQGSSTINQIEKIVNALPDVTERDIESIGATFGSILLSKKIVRDCRHSLDELIPYCCDDAMSLIKSLLVLDPDGRLTAKESIAHPYVLRFRSSSATLELRTEVKPTLNDDIRYCVNDYRTRLYEMIAPELRASARHSSATPKTPVAPPTGSDVQPPAAALTHVIRAVSKTSSHHRSVASSCHAAGQTEFVTQSISNMTKSWVDEQRKHHRQQQQFQKKHQPHQEQQQQLRPQLQLQQQQQQPQKHLPHLHRTNRNSNEPNSQLRRTAAKELPTQMAPHREQLSAVGAATATVEQPVRVRKSRKESNQRRLDKIKRLIEQTNTKSEQPAVAVATDNIEPQAEFQLNHLTMAHSQAIERMQSKAMQINVTLEQIKLEHQELVHNNYRNEVIHPQHKHFPHEQQNEELMDAAAYFCLNSRLRQLEDEMDKCKRQIFNYVQDNQQVLHEQSLCTQIGQLLQPSSSSSTSTSTTSPPVNSSQCDSGVNQNPIAATGSNSMLKRDKQKQLQFCEFLARDESNANAYEPPNLGNVYKFSQLHVHVQNDLAQSMASASSQRQLSSTLKKSTDCMPVQKDIRPVSRVYPNNLAFPGAQPHAREK